MQHSVIGIGLFLLLGAFVNDDIGISIARHGPH